MHGSMSETTSGQLDNVSETDEDWTTLVERTPSEPVSLSNADLRYLDQRVNRVNGKTVTRINVRPESATEYRLKPSQYVGVVALPSGQTLQIRPKEPAALFNMLAYVGDIQPSVFDTSAKYRSEGQFSDILGELYAAMLQRVAQGGIKPTYERVHQTQRKLRGRLDLKKQLQTQGPRPLMFESRYDDLTHDWVLNQGLLRAAELLSPVIQDASISGRLFQARQMLRSLGVSETSVSAEGLRRAADQVQLTREYGQTVEIAELILSGFRYQSFSYGTFHGASFLINMEDLFERMTRTAVSNVAREFNATASKETTGHLVRGIDDETTIGQELQPDIVLRTESSDDIVGILDAKWVSNPYPKKPHLYQITSYILNSSTKGALLYPNVDDQYTQEYELGDGFSLEVIEVDVSVHPYEDFVQTVEDAVRAYIRTLTSSDGRK